MPEMPHGRLGVIRLGRRPVPLVRTVVVRLERGTSPAAKVVEAKLDSRMRAVQQICRATSLDVSPSSTGRVA
jgi:hypothetical protein